MNTLTGEQTAVVKFLTLEGVNKREIFTRVKYVYGSYTLPKLQMYKLHCKFLEEGLFAAGEETVLEGKLINEKSSEEVELPSLHSKRFSEANSNNLKPYYNNKVNLVSSVNLNKFTPAIVEGDEKAEEDSPNIEIKKSKNIIFFKENRYLLRKEIVSGEEEEQGPKRLKTEVFSSSKRLNPPPQSVNLNLSNGIENDEKPRIYLDFEEHNLYDSKYLGNIATPENIHMYASELPEVNLPTLPLMDVGESLLLLLKLHSELRCLLCEGKRFHFLSHLRIHLSMHIKHSIVLQESRTLLCRRDCANEVKGHYHCPSCSMTSPHTKRVESHYSKHHSKKPNVLKAMAKKCVCVDAERGIFLVLKSKFGDDVPIHVQKLNYFEESKTNTCSQELCEYAMKVARENGNHELECKHLKDVMMEVQFQPPLFVLKKKDFQSLTLKENEIEECLGMSEKALCQGISLIVEWVSSDQCIHFSLFCDKPFAEMGRTLVSFFTEENKFFCSCPFHLRHFCVFKIISEIYYKKHFIS